MRSLEATLKLTVLPSCLKITVLGYPPLLEETPGVIAIIGVRGVRRRIWPGSSRCGGRRPAGLERKQPEAVIEDEPADALVDDSCYGRERSVLPHAAQPLADWDFFLQEIFHYVLVVVIFSCYGC